MIQALLRVVPQTRISEYWLIALVAIAFVVPWLVIWALIVIPQEYWPLKIVILVLALLAPAGFVAGYRSWVLVFRPKSRHP